MADVSTNDETNLLRSFMPINPVNPNRNEGLMKWQLEPNDIIEELEHYFKGELWTNKGWVSNPDMRLMNNKGVHKFLTILRGHLSKVISLSELNKYEINQIALECRQAVIDEIYYNHKEFEINKSFRDSLVMVIDHKVYAYLKQALNGGFRKYLQTTERFIETQKQGFEQQGEEKKSLLRIPKLW